MRFEFLRCNPTVVIIRAECRITRNNFHRRLGKIEACPNFSENILWNQEERSDERP